MFGFLNLGFVSPSPDLCREHMWTFKSQSMVLKHLIKWFAWQLLNRALTQDRIKQGLHFAKYCANVTGIVANACRKKTMLKYDSNSYFPRTDDGCPMLVVGYVGVLNRTHTPNVVFLVKLNAWVLWGNM